MTEEEALEEADQTEKMKDRLANAKEMLKNKTRVWILSVPISHE